MHAPRYFCALKHLEIVATENYDLYSGSAFASSLAL